MSKEELIEKLQDLQHDDPIEAENLLLEFINDPEITKAFNDVFFRL